VVLLYLQAEITHQLAVILLVFQDQVEVLI